MNHDQSLKELLLLPDGPPEGVWQAALNFAFTSENETPDDLVASINADNVSASLTPDADVDADETQDHDDQTDDVPLTTYDEQEDDISPSSHTSRDSSGLRDLDETGEDYDG